MPLEATVLQIIPHLPGSYDGVGDYALALARRLQANHGLRTTFAVPAATAVGEKEGFKVVSGLRSALSADCHHVILHYANYGYQGRGVPFALRDCARELRRRLPGRWITTFHEIYASGPPWRSAFWLRPFQVRIARDLIDLSNSCVVSNDIIKQEIARHDQGKAVHVVPVLSNFGEPSLSELDAKSSHRWAICGGTTLIERSLRAFARIQRFIPREYFPEQIEVIGGTATEGIRHELRGLEESMPNVFFRHHPQVTVETASQLLAACTFGWLDYFGTGKPWPGMIFKSSSFAALCAHGIVPIFAHEERVLSAGSEALPGPFFCVSNAIRFPERGQTVEIQRALHAWYNRNASSTHTAAVYAEALK